MTYLYDTHVHTMEVSPCCHVDAKEMINLYHKKNFKGLVITDHYFDWYFDNLGNISWEEKIESYMKGYKNAKDEAKKFDMDVILGLEIRFKEHINDYLIYGVTEEFLLNYPKLYEYTLKEFRDIAKENDLLIYQAHPFRDYCDFADPKLLDGIETNNANPRNSSNNKHAKKAAKKKKLYKISGSDFHEYDDEGFGGIVSDIILKDSIEFAKYLKNMGRNINCL